MAPAEVNIATVEVNEVLSVPSVNEIVKGPEVLDVVAAVVFFVHPVKRYIPVCTDPEASKVALVIVADCAVKSIFVAVPPVEYPWDLTNAVVASVVELSLADAVGAAGVPVNVGEAKGAAPVI